MKDLFSTAILGLVAVALMVGAWSLGENKQTFVPKSNAVVPVDLRQISNKIIDSRVVGSGADATVEYSYVGDRVQDKLDPEEVEWMRTESSWTRNRTTQSDFDRDEYRLETIIYPQNVFVKKIDGWHKVEQGVAPKKEFDQAMAPNWFASLFAKIAYADTERVYPGSGAGYIQGGGLGVAWATAHDAADGSAAVPGSYHEINSSLTTGKFGGTTIQRGFLPFDTSRISVKSTITAATLSTYVLQTSDSANDGLDYLTVVQTSQATHTTLTAADYDQCGAVTNPTEGVATGQRIDITSISAGSYITFTLNSTGLGWIKKSGQSSNCSATAGITCLGIREGHDATNTSVANDTGSYAELYSGGSTPAYLSITFTAPQSVLEGGIWMGGGGGKLNVVGGKVQIL